MISLLANILHIGVFAEQSQDSIVNTETTTKEPTTEEVIPEDAYVVAEIEKKRTEYSKEFLLSNGLHMAIVYPDSVHYAAKSGWEEIDNTLKTNANGMRTSRTNGTTTYNYVYDGSLLKELTVGANTLRFTYDASGTPLTVTFNGITYYYVTNLQGDVTAILTQARNPVVNYTYDAWGNILTFSGSLATTLGRYNPLTYWGYVYDQETGLYYLQSRYYDPEIGRWINVDSQLNTSLGMLGYNMFAYCLNNPSNMADFGGNKPGDLFDTMNEAARDAAIYLGSLSFENCWEYMTVIHSVTKLKVTCTPVTKTCRFLWWSWTTTSLKITITTTKYTYCAIYTDRSPEFVNIPLEAYFKSSLATVHTHPLGSGRGATQFSPGDYKTANDMGLIDYVHGPNGKLKKYDPSTGEEIFVFTDLPKSPKKPWLK